MKTLGTDIDGACIFYSDFVPDFAALVDSTLPQRPMAILIAADALIVSAELVARVAERFLDAGLGVICVWGPDCERVHDIFDDEYVGDGTIERDASMVSTWHDDESLEDAVEFLAANGIGLVDTDARPVGHLAIAVGNPEWAAVIDAVLSRFTFSGNGQ